MNYFDDDYSEKKNYGNLPMEVNQKKNYNLFSEFCQIIYSSRDLLID